MAALGNICLSDVVLVLGIGGAVAYIWKCSLAESDKRYQSNSFLHWLFAEERLSGDVLRHSVRSNHKRRPQVVTSDTLIVIMTPSSHG